jgi:hypothetical protein
MSAILAQSSHLHDIVSATQLEELCAGLHLHLAFRYKNIYTTCKTSTLALRTYLSYGGYQDGGSR